MRTFEQTMQEMSGDHERMKEMIRRFDEVLTEKANKLSVAEVYAYLANFVKTD